jgi:hypothetical protein
MIKVIMAAALVLCLIGAPTVLAYRTEKVCEIKTTKSGEKEHCRRVLVPEKNKEPEKKSSKK